MKENTNQPQPMSLLDNSETTAAVSPVSTEGTTPRVPNSSQLPPSPTGESPHPMRPRRNYKRAIVVCVILGCLLLVGCLGLLFWKVYDQYTYESKIKSGNFFQGSELVCGPEVRKEHELCAKIGSLSGVGSVELKRNWKFEIGASYSGQVHLQTDFTKEEAYQVMDRIYRIVHDSGMRERFSVLLLSPGAEWMDDEKQLGKADGLRCDKLQTLEERINRYKSAESGRPLSYETCQSDSEAICYNDPYTGRAYTPVPDDQLYEQVKAIPGVVRAEIERSEPCPGKVHYHGEAVITNKDEATQIVDQVYAILWQGPPDVEIDITFKTEDGYAFGNGNNVIDGVDDYGQLELRYGPQPGTGKPKSN